MLKICLIQEVLKDGDFSSGGEKVNYQILKALGESDFQVDVFCVENKLKNKVVVNNITELARENFVENAILIAKKLKYDLTFATDYFPTDVVYLHQHTNAYQEKVVKNKIQTLFNRFFCRKKYKKSLMENDLQIEITQDYKAILTPSVVLKNDLINLLHADGQKIYILPPPVDIPKHVKFKENKVFTLGFIGNDFVDKGGLILLNSLGKLKKQDFRLKIYNLPKNLATFLKYYLKLLGLEKKVEFVKSPLLIDEFYDEIDCLLMPSKRESFGLFALEAMSRGKIVVLSSRCGAKDVIEPYNNGFIFDITKNPDLNLARVLRYILSNKGDFENMRQKAVFTASVYNYEKFKQELIRILQKFAQEKTED